MDIKTTDLEISLADALFPYMSHQHPEQKFKDMDVIRRAAIFVRNERLFNDFLKTESNGQHTEFRLVVREDGTFYCHVMNRDSTTFDGRLFTETKKHWSY